VEGTTSAAGAARDDEGGGRDLVVDAQVHIWAEDTPERPWQPGGHAHAHIDRPFLAPELIGAMDASGIDRAVLIPPFWEGNRNDLVEQAAIDYPDRFAWLGRLNLKQDGPERLHQILARPGAVGVRLTFTRGEALNWLRDGTADWIWPELAAVGAPVMIFAPGKHQEVAAVASAHPDLRIAIDHAGIATDVKDQALLPLIQPLLEMATLPNVAVKATALPCLVSEPFPFPSLREPMRRLLESFGRERVFWGTDLTRLPCTYLEARRFAEELDFLSLEDRRWLLGRAVSLWLGWGE